jgi:hypothetical protein
VSSQARPVFEIVDRVAEIVALHFVLVVFVVHEHVQRVGEVGIGDFLPLELDHVELLVGAIDRLGTVAGQQILELHLDDGRVAAGLREFGLLHDHRILADHDHVAGAYFLGDFHDCTLRKWLIPGTSWLSVPVRKTVNYTTQLQP